MPQSNDTQDHQAKLLPNILYSCIFWNQKRNPSFMIFPINSFGQKKEFVDLLVFILIK